MILIDDHPLSMITNDYYCQPEEQDLPSSGYPKVPQIARVPQIACISGFPVVKVREHYENTLENTPGTLNGPHVWMGGSDMLRHSWRTWAKHISTASRSTRKYHDHL